MSATGEVTDFVRLNDLAARSGLTAWTLRRRLRRDGVGVWADPADERLRLVRKEDAERLLQPRLVTSRRETVAA
jgi:hypothetical protein